MLKRIFFWLWIAVLANPCNGICLEAFTGTVNTDNINLRTDANTSSAIICKLSKDTAAQVILEKYGWYKIQLPKSAPSYIKKSLLDPIDEKTAKAKGDNINIRLEPDPSSAILGKLQTNEVVTIVKDLGNWVKIEPTANTFGWVNNKFIDRKAPSQTQEGKKPESGISPSTNKIQAGDNVVIDGTIQPYGKVLNRIATHKLISADYTIYLLKGSTDNLNTLTYHKVKVSGKIVASTEKIPVIEIDKLEALD